MALDGVAGEVEGPETDAAAVYCVPSEEWEISRRIVDKAQPKNVNWYCDCTGEGACLHSIHASCSFYLKYTYATTD